VPLTPPAATVREELARRQLARGGWSYFDSNQVGIEPTCLAMLALSRHTGSHREVQKLLEWQNSDGSWPAFVGDGEGSWTTALALSTINILGGDNDAAGDKAAQWLLGTRGREGHWLWRWKFKLVDRQVRFDPDKFGWPWMPGSASWVIPTGFALIALKQRRACSDSSQLQSRVSVGVRMLLDRACPNGGWNSGNGVVYGEPLTAHAEPTAVALLALQDEHRNSCIRNSLNWLRDAAPSLVSVSSLAWAILSLFVFQERIDTLQERLAMLLQEPGRIKSTADLAVALVAFECGKVIHPFEVSE
jgi:hypothetical protein